MAPQGQQPRLTGQAAASPDQSATSLLPPPLHDASKQTHRLLRCEPHAEKLLTLWAPELPSPQLRPAGVLLPRLSGPPSEKRGSGSYLV